MISIEKVNDEVFSQKMMGDGVAIQPVNGKFYVSDRPGIGQELSEAAIAEELVHVTVDEP